MNGLTTPSVLLLIATVVGGAGCGQPAANDGGNSDVACGSSAVVDLHAGHPVWPPGKYTVNVSTTLPGSGMATCAFVAPDDIPTGGSVATVSCTGATGVSLAIAPNVRCQAGAGDGGVSEGCMPIDGEHMVVITIVGQPASAFLVIARDSTELIRGTFKFSYGQVGASSCYKASYDMTIAQ